MIMKRFAYSTSAIAIGVAVGYAALYFALWPGTLSLANTKFSVIMGALSGVVLSVILNLMLSSETWKRSNRILAVTGIWMSIFYCAFWLWATAIAAV
jgi:hypothetical protein